MKKIVIATTCAAVTLTAYPATACDWNRQASAKDPVVVATAPSTTVGRASQGAAAQPSGVASDEGNRKPVQESAPVVLVTDRH
ncbi:hypothetical protein Q2941_47515 [Bradyrhizobium sp. UFLA05-153]|uniref:hypothetical protein n=1 Tax=Bradyrhizobium sp. Ec3.3 TaxID=189753 RepID=UPI0004169675|nr:hypothetical protein [Bradyrhizobium sp. Ec3.3]